MADAGEENKTFLCRLMLEFINLKGNKMSEVMLGYFVIVNILLGAFLTFFLLLIGIFKSETRKVLIYLFLMLIYTMFSLVLLFRLDEGKEVIGMFGFTLMYCTVMLLSLIKLK